MPPVRGGTRGADGLGGSGIPDRNDDDAEEEEEEEEEEKDVRDFDTSSTKKSLPSCGAAASYTVIPIYYSSSNTSAGSTATAASSTTFFQESTVLGRQELATLWWKHCPNHCQSHLRAATTTDMIRTKRRRRPCRTFCQPLRDNVGMLSRKLIVLQHHRVAIHDECRFPDFVRVKSSRTDHHHHQPVPQQSTCSDPASSSSTYLLSLGDKDQVWMKFCVSVVQKQQGEVGSAPQRTCASAGHAAATTAGGACSNTTAVRLKKSTVMVSSSPTKASLSWSGSQHRPRQQQLKETSGDRKLPAVTPTTTASRKRQRQNESPGSSQGTTSSSSDGSGCKRRLFETQQVDADEKVVGSMNGNSPPEKLLPLMQLRPLRLWPNSNYTLSSSFLSLPMPHDSEGSNDSSSSCPVDSQPPIQDAVTQFEWAGGGNGDGKNEQRYCADLTLSDWETIQSKNTGDQGTFGSAMVDLIAFRNADEQGGKKSGSDKDVWIPSLLASAQLNNKPNQKR